jgi:carbon-monoxide dehydrogenase medium subunit
MYPANFEYVRATSAQEAVDLLAQDAEAKLLAGGHSLIPMMKLRLAQPAKLIDIGRIAELRGICEKDGALRIGSLTTHDAIANSELVRKKCSILAGAASKIGDPQVRNKGTIGGNIAHADPASDLPAVLVALGATIHLLGPGGTRTLAAGEFFTGLLETAMTAGEILTEIEVPACCESGSGCTYLKVEHPASGYAVCGAAAVVKMESGTCTAASLCFNGVTATVLNAWPNGSPLVGGPADDAAIAAAMAELTIDEPMGDIHASGEYRVALARAYGKRALIAARERS